MKCLNCEVVTNNPKFCSRSCAAKHNNKYRLKSISCRYCKTDIERKHADDKRKICSDCKTKKRPNGLYCKVCEKGLTGRQKKFCSKECKNATTNKKHQNYQSQQTRGAERKKRLVRMSGGGCNICGYNKNYAALTFHHLKSEEKEFGLDLRSLSNNSWKRILQEYVKCQLLCHNCHAEIHHPDLLLS